MHLLLLPKRPRDSWGMISHLGIAVLWLVCLFAGLCAVCARLAHDLWNVSIDVPSEPEELRHWSRRRRWMIWSNFAALPCFATIGVSAVLYYDIPNVVAVLISMALGALGFGFLLNGLQAIIRKRVGIEP